MLLKIYFEERFLFSGGEFSLFIKLTCLYSSLCNHGAASFLRRERVQVFALFRVHPLQYRIRLLKCVHTYKCVCGERESVCVYVCGCGRERGVVSMGVGVGDGCVLMLTFTHQNLRCFAI